MWSRLSFLRGVRYGGYVGPGSSIRPARSQPSGRLTGSSLSAGASGAERGGLWKLILENIRQTFSTFGG